MSKVTRAGLVRVGARPTLATIPHLIRTGLGIAALACLSTAVAYAGSTQGVA